MLTQIKKKKREREKILIKKKKSHHIVSMLHYVQNAVARNN